MGKIEIVVFKKKDRNVKIIVLFKKVMQNLKKKNNKFKFFYKSDNKLKN